MRLRARLTLIAATAVAGVLVVSGFGLVLAQERSMTRSIDEALLQRADNLGGPVTAGSLGPALLAEGDPEDTFGQVVDRGGRVLTASANVRGSPALARPPEAGSTESLRTLRGIPLSRHRFRVLSRTVPTGSGPVTLVVGKNLDDVREGVAILRTSLLVAVPLVVGLLLGLVWWLTGRVLRPVEAIRAEVAGIDGDELHRRVPVGSSPDEISRLAATMNAMLDRVQHASERERQFVADVSHEFRTPLTRLRSALEIALSQPRSTDAPATYRSLLEDTEHLQRLLEGLLFLARSQAGATLNRCEVVDLDDLVLAEARRLRENAVVQVVTRGVGAARVRGDADQLARVVRNLADNAERHARRRVEFELRETGEFSELVVADDGPGIPEEHRDLVFGRFVRLDEHGGTGLGLAIVLDIVTRHGGTIRVGSAAAQGARLVVRLARTS